MSLPTLFFITITLLMMIEVALFFINSKEALIRTQYGETCTSAVANAGYVQAMQASVLVIAFYAIWGSTNFQKKVTRAFWLWGVLTILFSFVLRPPIPPPANRYPILPVLQTAFAIVITLLASLLQWKYFPRDEPSVTKRSLSFVDIVFYVAAAGGILFLLFVLWDPANMYDTFYPSSKEKCFATYGLFATFVTQVGLRLVLDFYTPSFSHQEKRYALRSLAVLSALMILNMSKYWDYLKGYTMYYGIMTQLILQLIVGLWFGVILK